MKNPRTLDFPRYQSALAALIGVLFSGAALASPPTVTLTSPAEGAVFGAAVLDVRLSANASDADGTISKVEFYLNENLTRVSYLPEPGTRITFESYLGFRPAPGTYSITARAYDNSGESTTSTARTLIVPPTPPLPIVTNGLATPAAVMATVNATVSPGEFYVDPRQVYFQYGLSSSYGSEAPASGNPQEFYDSSRPIKSVVGYFQQLERNTTYHYRLAATTWAGTAFSPDATFTTLANTPPVARDAATNVTSSEPVGVYPYFDDPDNETVTITGVSTPSHGTVVIESVQTDRAWLTYTPDATFDGEDEFTYTVSDQHGATATATAYLSNYRKTAVGRYATTIMVDYGSGPRRAIGALGLDVTATGRFTGVVRFFEARYPIRGQFSVDGYCELEIDRLGEPPITINLSENGGPGGIRIGGGLHASSRDYEVIQDTALVFPTAAPQVGTYTFALPPNRDDLPQGNGFVTGRVSRSGAVSFVGRIGDGQAFSFGSQLRRGGSAQFYVVAGDAPRDRLSGRLQFPADAGTEAAGNLVWFKAPRTTGFFQSGFTSELTVVGSRLDVSAADEPILDYTGETLGLEIAFTDAENNALLDGLLAGLGEDALVFADPALALRAVSPRARAAAILPKVEFKVSRARGLFSGTFRNPAEAGRVRSFGGVFLQHQNSGTGLFMLGGRTGTVTITPQ